MRYSIFWFFSIFFILGCENNQGSLLKIIDSKYKASETSIRFSAKLKSKGYSLENKIDKSEIAKLQNIYLKPTYSLSLNSPKVYSAILTCNPSMAMEFPIRVSIYTELGGSVKLAYTNPEYWTLKHNIKDKNCIAVILQMAQHFSEAAKEIIK